MPSQLTKLTCPGCGAKLQVSPDSTQFLCSYCGFQYALSRESGGVEMGPILSYLKTIRAATLESARQTTRVAMQFELSQLERDLPALEKEYRTRRNDHRWWPALWGTSLLVLVGALSRSWSLLAVFGSTLALVVALRVRARAALKFSEGRLRQAHARIAEIQKELGHQL